MAIISFCIYNLVLRGYQDAPARYAAYHKAAYNTIKLPKEFKDLSFEQ